MPTVPRSAQELDPRIGDLRIANCTVSASASSDGSGIGSGSARAIQSSEAISSVDHLNIANSTIHAISFGGGSGIGTATIENGKSEIDELVIGDSIVNATGSSSFSAIGSGGQLKGSDSGNPVVSLKFEGEVSIECETGEGLPAIVAQSIEIAAISLSILTSRTPAFGSPPINTDLFDLIILYRIPTNCSAVERLGSLSGTYLHIGEINQLPIEYSAVHSFGRMRWGGDITSQVISLMTITFLWRL
jgi:hypothetical protein